MRYTHLALLLSLPLIFVSCQAISEDAKDNLAKPVDCKHAHYDIEILEGEKASTGKRAVMGVTSVTPAGAALTILGGQVKDKGKVVGGEYNQMIDDKIAEIRRTCGVKGIYE